MRYGGCETCLADTWERGIAMGSSEAIIAAMLSTVYRQPSSGRKSTLFLDCHDGCSISLSATTLYLSIRKAQYTSIVHIQGQSHLLSRIVLSECTLA
jgi:hypothetical protein